jgi:cytosine/adenosine deaminase-related metal-dependent hydrolase
MLLGKLKNGADLMSARDALEIATRGGAGCLGRGGELGVLAVGAVADMAVWKLEGPAFAGVLDDPIEGWLRCGPIGAYHTIVAGKPVVEAGQLVSPKLDEMLSTHRTISRRFQPV